MAGELVEVHGTYWTADNIPERGTVTFTPVLSAPMSGDPSRVVSQGKVTADLDEDGSFTVELLASDDPGWQTDGPVPYRVVERLSCQVRSYLVIVPTNPSGTDITVLQPPSDSDVVVLPVLGPPGPPGDDGAPGEPGPPGPPGLGIRILSAVPTVADLPAVGAEGDAHLVIESGDLYVWGTDGAWHDSGHVQGPPGPAGPAGPGTVPDPWGYYRDDYPQWTPEQSWSKGDICFNDGQYWVIWYDAPSQVDDPLIEEPTVANDGGNSWFSVNLFYLAYEMVRGGLSAIDAGWSLNAALGGEASSPPDEWEAKAYRAKDAVRHQPVELGPYYLYVALENTGPTDVPGESPKWRLAYITDGTLGGLTDVDAPVDTPPRMGLGTTAVGEWGPVAFTPLDPENDAPPQWSASTRYFPGNIVVGSDGYYYTSDTVQNGGSAPSLSNLATWTVVSGKWNAVRAQQGISYPAAIIGTTGLPSFWEQRSYTIGNLVAHRKADGNYGLWVAAAAPGPADVPGVSDKWDRFDLTGLHDRVYTGLTLSGLQDVSDNVAGAPAGKFFGTTAVGQWGPVDPPAGGGGPSPATTNPVSVSVASSLVGTSLDYARADHKHTVQVANPVALGAAAAGGSSSALARADHVHPVPFWKGTQAEYDAIATKDPNILYCVAG